VFLFWPRVSSVRSHHCYHREALRTGPPQAEKGAARNQSAISPDVMVTSFNFGRIANGKEKPHTPPPLVSDIPAGPVTQV
jgi:hypothetical protein